MASNREERLQMRQRGAGTRQIKAVDFGFSFGLPGPEPAEPPRQPPRASTNPPVPRVSPRRSATPHKQPTPPSQPRPATPSSGSRTSQRDQLRSSSSRNHLPERPSTFDLPSDDVPEQGRSAKRRRISPRSENAKSTSNGKRTEQVDRQSGTIPSRDAAENPSLAEESPTIARTNTQRPRDTTSAERGSEQQVEPVSQAANGTNGVDKGHGDEVQSADAADPSITSSKSQRKKRTSTAEHRKSGPTVESAADVNNSERIEEPVEEAQPSRLSRRSPKTVEPQETSSPQETRKRGRQAAKATSNARKDTEKETSPAEENSRQPKRSRKSLGKQREVPVDDDRVEERQQAEPEEAEEQEENQASRQKRTKKGKQRKSSGRPPTRNRPSTESVPEEPEASSSRQRQDIESEEQVDQPQAESSTQRESSATKKAPNKTKARKEKATRTEDDNDEAEAEPTTREKRTRGETVPVTVHRLANVEALNAVPDSSESGDEAEESTVKVLSGRSGVNPADVLSQICRETLDKTLATLKNGIANESNQARRAEWTRKRKAVEAFGAELEGRLFEMSEMLDSNFSLSAQLKKAKRKMADMRSRLLHIRRQREEVALRMDEVRRKHTEEENAKMARNAINHSLHSLELAVDRNKARNDRPSDNDEPTTAGLEFMLRTVAENVSSAAPGSQGGLLNQIKSFNAQLERAAKNLERMI